MQHDSGEHNQQCIGTTLFDQNGNIIYPVNLNCAVSLKFLLLQLLSETTSIKTHGEINHDLCSETPTLSHETITERF